MSKEEPWVYQKQGKHEWMIGVQGSPGGLFWVSDEESARCACRLINNLEDSIAKLSEKAWMYDQLNK